MALPRLTTLGNEAKGNKMSEEGRKLKKAVLWKSVEDGKVRCNLWNHRCLISAGKTGTEFVKLVLEAWGREGQALHSKVYTGGKRG